MTSEEHPVTDPTVTAAGSDGQQTVVDLSDPEQYDPKAYAPAAGDTCGSCHHRVDQHDSDGHGECWGDLGLCRCGGAW